MPSAIDATVGGASANSFVTQAEAVTYAGDHLNATAFSGASSNDQIIALLEATRWLNVRQWVGLKSSVAQALQWPRSLAPDPDSSFGMWAYFDQTIVPVRVKNAACELALQFLIAGTTDLAAFDQTRNIRRKQVDVLSTEYFDPGQRPQGLQALPSVMRFIAPLLIDSTSTIPIRRA